MAVVMIAGMHRAGTSMVTRLLNHCGLYLGEERELLPADSDNMEGFWENDLFVKINDQILTTLKGTWYKPPKRWSGWELSPDFLPIHDRAVRLIQQFDSYQNWGWKDPRNSITLPFWQHLIPGLKLIVCLRNPIEVADSLAYRDRFTKRFGLDLWHTYYQDLLFFSTPENRLITHYDSYFSDSPAELQRVLDYVGISKEKNVIQNACLTVLPFLKHNHTTLDKLIAGAVPLKTINLYAEMCVHAGPIYLNALAAHSLVVKDADRIVTTRNEYDLLLGLIKKLPSQKTLTTKIIEISKSLHQIFAQKTGSNFNVVEKINTLTEKILGSNVENTALTLRKSSPRLVSYGSWLKNFSRLLIHVLSIRNRAAFLEIWKKIRYHLEFTICYRYWIPRSEPRLATMLKLQETSSVFQFHPLISVVMPVYNPSPKILDEAIRSVRMQSYPYFELCIADDVSLDPQIRSLVKKHAHEDGRIKYIFRELNGHISEATNSALQMATGDFFALLDHDDKLHPLALYYVAEEIIAHPDAEVIYSDEDKLDVSGRRISPYFKPDFNYDLFLSQNMISHLGVYRTATVRAIGGFRIGFEGSQDYDLALRVLDHIEPQQIYHIPRILYHWRISDYSVAAQIYEKPYAFEAARRAIGEHLKRKGVDAFVYAIPRFSAYRVKYALPVPQPSVEIIIFSEGPSAMLRDCVKAILTATRYDNYIISLLINEQDGALDLSWISILDEKHRVAIVQNDPKILQAEAVNRQAKNSRTDLICILDEKIQDYSAEWLSELISHAVRPGVGAAGPKILKSKGNHVYSAGMVLGIRDLTSNLFFDMPAHDPGYFGWAELQRDTTILSPACFIVRRSHYLDVGGFADTLCSQHYMCIDFFLRLHEKGLRNIYEPYSSVTYSSHDSTGADVDKDMDYGKLNGDQEYIKAQWQAWIDHDPSFNPNLDLKNGQIVLTQRLRNNHV